jgi:hypothetical protein
MGLGGRSLFPYKSPTSGDLNTDQGKLIPSDKKEISAYSSQMAW